MAIAERYIDVAGIRTRYLEAGSGPPLILIHGGHFGRYACADDWRTNIEGLAGRFRVLAPDKIGLGYTDNPKTDAGYVIGATVDHAYNFMRAVGLQSAHFAGHSRGGYAVARLALERPEAVRTLIIVSSATLMIPPNPVYREWNRQAAQIADPRERTRFLVAANSFSGKHVTEDMIDRLLAIEALPKTQEAHTKMTGPLWDQFQSDLVAKQAETKAWIARDGLKHATLVVWGYNDPSARFDPIGMDAIRLIVPHAPRSEVHVFNQAGHYVFREQPRGFDDVVGDFIVRYGAE